MWQWIAIAGNWQDAAQSVILAIIFAFMIAKLVSLIISIRSDNLRVERSTDEDSAFVERYPEDTSLLEGDSPESQSESEAETAASTGPRVEEKPEYFVHSEVKNKERDIEITDDASQPVEGLIIEDSKIPGEGSLARSEAVEMPVSSTEREVEVEKEAQTGNDSGKIQSVQAQEESSDDNSDWEGVESTELDEHFGAAASYVAAVGHAVKIPQDAQLQLYGLYKIATEGPCRIPQPSALKMTARAKWNAWQKLGDISQEEAMQRYITIVSEIAPDWNQDPQNKLKERESSSRQSSATSSSSKQSTMGPVFSIPTNEERAGDEGTLEEVHVCARQGDIDGLGKLFERGTPVDLEDSEGRTALHWASDQGHLEVVKLLVAKGAEVDAKDHEGQTPLHYAAICDQEEIARFLVDKGAGIHSSDNEGSMPSKICPTSWTWMK